MDVCLPVLKESEKGSTVYILYRWVNIILQTLMSIQACLLIFWLHIYLSWQSRDYTGNFPKFTLSTNCSTLSLTLFRLRVNCEMEHIIFCFLMFAIQNIMVPHAINCSSVCFFFLTPIAKLSSSNWRSYRPRHWRRVCFQVLKTYITHIEIKG